MRRILLWVLRLCLCMMLAVIFHEFLAEGIGLGERPTLVGFLPLLISYVVGSVFPGKKRGWLLFLPACAASVCLQALFLGAPLALSAETGLLVIDAVLLFILGWSRNEAWPSALGLPAVGFSLLTCAILSWQGKASAFPGLCAVLVMVIWLITLFLGLSLGLAAVPFLQGGADRLWETAVSGTKELTSSAAAKLREKADQPPAETPAPSPSPSPSPTPEPEPEEGVPEEGIPPALRYGWVVVATLLIAALLYLWCKGGKTGFSLRKLGERLKRLFRESGQDVPYVDEVEKIRPWKSLTDPAIESVITRIRKARRKRIRLSDLPDDRQRIRYVYRELIRNPAGVTLSPAMTPSEVGLAYQSEPIRELVTEYNIVRYSPQAEASQDAGSIAVSAMKELRSAARKQAIHRSQLGGQTKDKPNGAKHKTSPGSTHDAGETPVSLAASDADMDNLAILPAIPVWLPFASVWVNIRCAAQDKDAALRAAEVVGLPNELLHKSPNTLTEEQRWLVVMARSLAAGAGQWEVDISSLSHELSESVSTVLQQASTHAGIQVKMILPED